jgi:uncharacterized RDD family membrane protein YckC
MTDPIQPGSEDLPAVPDLAPDAPEIETTTMATPSFTEPAEADESVVEAAAVTAEAAEPTALGEPVAVAAAAAAATPPPPPPVAPLAPETAWTMPPRVIAGPAPGIAFVGFWRRFVAFAIDGVIFSFVFWAVTALVFTRADYSRWRELLKVDPDSGRVLATNAEVLSVMGDIIGLTVAVFGLFWLLHALYHIVFWAWRGGTIGQLALGIQIRRESDGTRIGWGTSIVRYIGYLISFWVFYLGVIWIAFDGRKQGWHDKIANTLVIRRAD